MSRRILLMRHAKSSWDDPALPDHDRPLNGRGRRAAETIAAHLRAHALVPDLVLCSSATRATETLSRMALDVPDVEVRDELYGADDEALLAAIHAIPDHVASAAVIAHDPGMHELASRLLGDGVGADAERLRERFPTGAVAVFEHDGPWAGLDAPHARLVAFLRPKDLV